MTSSQFIRAGAGAGKTTKLIETFLNFVREFKLKNARYPRVVMTTFTRKATQEVRERLLISALRANEKEIFEYINKKSFVHISTIHGLLSIYLSQYAERMKFPQEIKIIDDNQYKRILKKIINELLKNNTSYLELIEQYSFKQLVDLAAAVLNFKAQNKKFSFVQKEELMILAQQKKQNIISDIESIELQVPVVPESWNVYFSFLKDVAQALKQNNENDVLELIDSEPTKPRWSNAKPPFDPLAHAIIEDLREKKFKDLFDTEDFILKHQNLNELFFNFSQELFEVVMLQKRNTGELTISDLENLSLQLLEDHPDTALDFSNNWDYFMVDEYQDTSPLQVRLLNQIIRDKPCFVVGDPQQSIYLFRGARSEVFNEKLVEMQNKKAEIIFLETNYRSEPSLMRFINQFFTDFSSQFKPMLIKEQKSDSKILDHDAFYIKCKNQSDATLKQIEYLLKQGVNPRDICVLSRSNRKLVEIAVNASKVSIPVQLQAAAGFEAKREILDLIAFNKFLNNPHDDENLITLIRSPWFYISDEIILQLAQSPSARKYSLWIALKSLDKNLDKSADRGADKGLEKVSEFLQKDRLIKYLNLFNEVGAFQATKQFIAETSFVSLSEFYDKTGKREANIFKFLTCLAQAEKSAGFSLGQFIEEEFQSLQSDLGSANSEAQPVLQPNCVSLMTVHASKGLQFKHVIVIGFSEPPKLSNALKLTFDDNSQKFSLSVFNEITSKHQNSGWSSMIKAQFNERELNENERVLYVAMTRAIESLSLVAEINKKTASEKSWYKRSKWPLELTDETSIEEDQKALEYRVASLFYEEAPLNQSQVAKIEFVARNKFLDQNLNPTSTDSVTDLINQSSSHAGVINYESTIVNLKKAQKGSDLHRIFEALKYSSQEHVQGRILEKLNEQDRKSIKFLLEQSDLNLKDILRKGHNEWGFGLKTKSRFLQGQIDLWGELDDEIHVLDYKTGSSFYSDKAFQQLALYTRALFEMKVISTHKKIIHSVVYPAEGLIKKKDFKDFDHFEKNLESKIKDLF